MVVVVLLGPDQDVAPAHPRGEVRVPIRWHGHARGKLGVRGPGSPAQQTVGVATHPPPGETEAGHPGPGDAAGVVHPVVGARSCREGVGVPGGTPTPGAWRTRSSEGGARGRCADRTPCATAPAGSSIGCRRLARRADLSARSPTGSRSREPSIEGRDAPGRGAPHHATPPRDPRPRRFGTGAWPAPPSGWKCWRWAGAAGASYRRQRPQPQNRASQDER